MWKRLDHLKNYRPVCTADATSFKEYVEGERIFKFLAGLNSKFDQVRSQILGIEPLPSLREAFAYVQNEESRQSAMLPPSFTDRSAMSTSSQRGGKGPSYNSQRDQPAEHTETRDSKWCDHCNTPEHIHATCWKLHSRPPSSRG